ncbi:MAG: hypothetical protein EOO88_21245 [Pedobacter sp.]|nr:MAG: hypothetical protein EOO88_21245 [Pedobacter sp.]
MLMRRLLKRSMYIGLMCCLYSCASYNEKITPYYKEIAAGSYTEAQTALNQNKLLQKPRNKLLFYMEKGRTSHLLGAYTESNLYFNLADSLLERGLGGTMDAAVGTLLNPMSQTYKGEDFEKFMIHYYKALNYVYLNKPEDAIVEARRITIQSQEQDDKFANAKNRYAADAFSLMFQGLLYEHTGDLNDAFISYRNAAELYLKQPDTTYYGTKIPVVLKQDVIRTAALNGFEDEKQRFERIFNLKAPASAPGGELVFFWENGLAPIKQERDFVLARGSNGDFAFTDGNIVVPFYESYYGGNFNEKSVQSLRVAYPVYVSRASYFTGATLDNGKDSVRLQQTENIGVLAFKTLEQRFAREMAKTLARLAVKKGAETLVSESAKGSGRNGKDDALLKGIGYGLQLYNLLSEQADTRNWQTLPATISYVRIPLQNGDNTINLTLSGPNGATETRVFHVQGTGKLSFYNYSTLK